MDLATACPPTGGDAARKCDGATTEMLDQEEIRFYFDMYGPFEIAREAGQIGSGQAEMWEHVREACRCQRYDEKQLETAIGCYAFGLGHGETLRPWYVGMTLAKGGFRAEVFQKHKLDHYNEVVSQHRGTPVMFLMPLLTPSGQFSRDRGLSGPLIGWVEKMLFGVALKRNPYCRNQRDTKYLRSVEVRGVFNSKRRGPKGATVTAARQMFGVGGG